MWLFFDFVFTTSPPRPYSLPELLPLWAGFLLSLLCRQPGSCPIRGQQPMRSLHIQYSQDVILGSSSVSWWDRGSFGAPPSLSPFAERSSLLGSGCPLGLERRAGVTRAGRDRHTITVTRTSPAKGRGWECYGTPECTSAYIKRNVVILRFRERDKWLETKLPDPWTWTRPLALSFPHPSLPRKKKDRQGLLIWLVWGWTS